MAIQRFSIVQELPEILRMFRLKWRYTRTPASKKMRQLREKGRRDPRYMALKEQVVSNMRAVLGDIYDSGRLEALALQHVQFQAVLDEAFYLAKYRGFAREACWQFKGLSYLDEALRAGRGAIIITAHFGYVKLLKPALLCKGYPARLVRQKKSEKKIKQLRKELGRHTALYRYLYRKLDVYVHHDPTDPLADLNIKPVLNCLKRNEVIIALVDAVHASSFIYVPLFSGRSVPLTTGMHSLAYGSGTPLIPAFALDRDGGRTVVFQFYPPVQWPEQLEGPKKKIIQNAARQFGELFKQHVEERPDLYVPAWVRDQFFERRKMRSRQDISRRY